MDTGAAPRLWERPRLLALTIGLPLLEAVLVWTFASPSTLALAPHASAPEPFGVFHDLRWILVYHPNWAAFAAEAAALLVFRTAVTTLILREVWPQDHGIPPWLRLIGRSFAFTAIAATLLSPWAALAFGIGVMSLSWLFYVAVPLTLVMALAMHPAVVDRTWWRHPPPLRTIGWVLASFGVLTLLGGLAASAPPLLRLPVIAGAGGFNAWAWHGVVRGVVCRDVRQRRFLPVAPVGAAAFVGIAALGTTLGFQFARPHGHPFDTIAAPEEGRPVLVVTGFGSGWSGKPQHRFDGPFTERRFSYAGIDASGDPLPFDGDDTLKALPELTRLMDAQVREFADDTGKPVGIVAESEGALLAKAYLASAPDAPVDRLVMLSPLARPARVYYPPGGEDGWGVAAAWELRGLSALIRGLSPLTVDTDTAIFRSISDHGGALRDVVPCSLEGVEQLLITPVADAVAAAEFDAGDLRVIDVPDFHGGLLSDGRARRLVAAELRGEHPSGWETWSIGADALRALAAGWQVPELEASLNPAWEDQEHGDCNSVRSYLQGWAAA